MTELIYFIIGVLFTVIFMPIVESIVELIQVIIEAQKAKIALKVANLNGEIKKLTSSDEEQISVIGFQAPEVEEYEEDDDI